MAFISLDDLQAQPSQQNNNGQSQQNNSQTYAQQASQQPVYSPRMAEVNPLLNPNLVQQQATAESTGKLQPTQTESLGAKAGEEVIGGASAIAKDAELGDLVTSAMRARMENYAQAYRGGAIGSMYDNLRGSLGQHPITKTLTGGIDPDAIAARSAFESSTNGLLSQGQQVFNQQMGSGQASLRIMATVLDLLKGEFGSTSDSPSSMMGRTQGSQQTIYLIQKFGGQYLNKLNQMGITPANIDNLPKTAIDKIAEGFGNTVHQSINNYQLTPQDRAIIKSRTDYINEPLQEIMNKGKSGSVDYKDLLKDIK